MQAKPSPGAQAKAIERQFPGYSVTITVRGDESIHYEAVTRNDGNPWCLISDDAGEIWRELSASHPVERAS